MSGTLFGLGLSQQVDINGQPLSGCLLYLYLASTSSPADAYQDFGLSVLLTNPLQADASGRIPQFWLADGLYRARLTTDDGIEVFDMDGIQSIGASTTTSSGGGGGGTSVDTNAILHTGDFLWSPIAGTRAGFIRANARTFGSASSGGTERANADTQALYEFFWNNFSNTLCPVTGGRGASAVIDFGANKPMATLDMRDRGIYGLGDMGNSNAGLIVTGTPTAAGSAIGAEKTSITIAQVNLPSYNLSTGSLSISDTRTFQFSQRDTTDTESVAAGGNSAANNSNVTATINMAAPASGSIAIAGTLPSGGSGTALTPTTISLGRFGTWFVRL